MFIFFGIYHFDERTDHRVMTISDIRRSTARILSTRVGGPAEFARKVGMSDSHISQLLGEKPTKNIGNKIARRFESAFGAPVGWLDVARSDTELDDLIGASGGNATGEERVQDKTAYTPFTIDPVEIEIINAYRRSNPAGKLSIKAASIAAEKKS
jgi:transcriptional regulator with XRE-family HTH domain